MQNLIALEVLLRIANKWKKWDVTGRSLMLLCSQTIGLKALKG
jgi:hypothetical protein